MLAADGGGNGYVFNRLLVDKLQQRCLLYAIHYSTSGQGPCQDGLLWRWTVSRSWSIGGVFSRVKKRSIFFPRLQDCRSYPEELACETAEYDAHQRSIKHSHPETQPDDSLHATNYALLMGVRQHAAKNAGMGLPNYF